jgi:hypothetical protein
MEEPKNMGKAVSVRLAMTTSYAIKPGKSSG